jgi:DnaJ-class molecular chaperone
MPHRDGEIQQPSSQDVKQAYHRKSKQYHMDKRYHPDRQQARLRTSVREKMMPKVTGAFEFLQGDANRQGFCNRIAGLFRLEGGVACFVLSLMN